LFDERTELFLNTLEYKNIDDKINAAMNVFLTNKKSAPIKTHLPRNSCGLSKTERKHKPNYFWFSIYTIQKEFIFS